MQALIINTNTGTQATIDPKRYLNDITGLLWDDEYVIYAFAPILMLHNDSKSVECFIQEECVVLEDKYEYLKFDEYDIYDFVFMFGAPGNVPWAEWIRFDGVLQDVLAYPETIVL